MLLLTNFGNETINNILRLGSHKNIS